LICILLSAVGCASRPAPPATPVAWPARVEARPPYTLTADFDQRVGGPPAFIPQFVATLYNELPAR